MNDISDPEIREKIAETLSVEIDDWCEREYDDGHRRHLGGSKIGKACSRELWYDFRWARREKFGEGTKRTAGQVLRVFQRGHREEEVLTEYLRGIGCTFDYTKEDQVRIEGCGGHYGGSLDNVGTLPAKFGITEKILFEFKTANLSYFNKIVKNRCKLGMPTHWSQICAYGFKLGLNYCLYICACKDNDLIHIELLEIDHEHGEMMENRALQIITTPTAPQRISMSPANFACKWCNYKDICHHGEAVEKNCRSCQHAKPLENKKWGCTLYNQEIPDDFIPKGCDQHKGIE